MKLTALFVEGAIKVLWDVEGRVCCVQIRRLGKRIWLGSSQNEVIMLLSLPEVARGVLPADPR